MYYINKAYASVLINNDLSLARCHTDQMVRPVPWVYEVEMSFLMHVALCAK